MTTKRRLPPLFVEFHISPTDFAQFRKHSREHDDDCRFTHFVDCWAERGILLIETTIEEWEEQVRAAAETHPIDAANDVDDPLILVIERALRSELLIRSGLPQSVVHEASLDWSHWESPESANGEPRLGASHGAILIPGHKTEVQVPITAGSNTTSWRPDGQPELFNVLRPAAHAASTVYLIDRYFASTAEWDSEGIIASRTNFADFLSHFENIKLVCIACAFYDSKVDHGKPNIAKLREFDTFEHSIHALVAGAYRTRGYASPKVEIRKHSLSQTDFFTRSHDRYIAFVRNTSDDGFAVQLGLGLQSFATQSYPITLSRIHRERVRSIWDDFPTLQRAS